jgi:cobalt-zinc-cadmium efflux system outer membrane protein
MSMQQLGFLVVSLFCWFSISSAVPAENMITFSKARELILANNSGLKAVGIDTLAAQAGLRQAGVLPNPSVSAALDRFGANEIEVSVEQTVELGGKRQIRKESAQIEIDAAKNNRRISQLELEAEIVRRFIPIAIASGRLTVLDSIIATAEATKDQIKKRVDAGASKRTDLIRAEIDIEQYLLQRSEFVRELSQARKKFAALGGEQDSILAHVSGILNTRIELPTLDDLRKTIVTSPQIFAIDIDKARLAAQQKQFRADAVPDLNLSAGVLRNNVDHDFSPLLGASISLPFFNSNTAVQQQVQLQQQAIAERKKGSLRVIDAVVEDLYSRIMEMDKKLISLKTITLPKADSVYSMLQEYYNAASVGFLDLTAIRTEMLRIRMDLLDIEAERAQKLVDLMQTTSLHIQIVK